MRRRRELVGLSVTEWLIVRLGNPGAEYAQTRHNLGFMLVDMLAEKAGVPIKREECRSLVGRAEIENKSVELVKPLTYMNVSGEAVSCLLAKEQRRDSKLLVISDDLALPFGKIRIRPRGTHGGHNGLRSIIDLLNTQEFIRLRIGIQPEHPVADAKRFVLERFAKGDAEMLKEALERSAEAVETIISQGIGPAMAKFN